MSSEPAPTIPTETFARRWVIWAVVCLVAFIGLTGLAFWWGAFGRFSPQNFERVQNGMHWTEVIMIMGCWPGEYRKPSGRSTFRDPGVILDGGWTAQWDTDYGMFHVNFDPKTKRVRNKVYWP